MSWLVADAHSRDDVLALHPALAANHQRLLDEIWDSSLDAVLLEYCRLRTATILQNQIAWDEPRSAAAKTAGLDESLIAELTIGPRILALTPQPKRAWDWPSNT